MPSYCDRVGWMQYFVCRWNHNDKNHKSHFCGIMWQWLMQYLTFSLNKCIEDDTKATCRQSLNCIINQKKPIKYGEKRFSIYGGWNSYTLQCGMWVWNRDSEFTKWQDPAMWYVALGWHAIEFAQTSAILEFYIWFPFPHITAVDMSFCTSLRNFIQIGPP